MRTVHLNYFGEPIQETWRDDVAARHDAEAVRFRKLGCFELANDRAESAYTVRDGSDWSPIRTFPLFERVELSKTSSYEWDRLRDEGVELTHARPFGPSRKASSRCESGGHDYCSCGRCF